MSELSKKLGLIVGGEAARPGTSSPVRSCIKKRKNKKEKRLSDIIWYSTFQQMAFIETSIKLDLYKVLVFL